MAPARDDTVFCQRFQLYAIIFPNDEALRAQRRLSADVANPHSLTGTARKSEANCAAREGYSCAGLRPRKPGAAGKSSALRREASPPTARSSLTCGEWQRVRGTW